MEKRAKWMVYGLAGLMVALQGIRPPRNNPPVDPSRTIYEQLQVPADVRAVLERSCGDCHSNQTRWPWYSNVAPVSWFVADHVNHGRRHMNFSHWADYDDEHARSLFQNIVLQVKARGEMPPKSYLLMHPDARDVGVLIGWAETGRSRLRRRQSTIENPASGAYR